MRNRRWCSKAEVGRAYLLGMGWELDDGTPTTQPAVDKTSAEKMELISAAFLKEQIRRADALEGQNAKIDCLCRILKRIVNLLDPAAAKCKEQAAKKPMLISNDWLAWRRRKAARILERMRRAKERRRYQAVLKLDMIRGTPQPVQRTPDRVSSRKAARILEERVKRARGRRKGGPHV